MLGLQTQSSSISTIRLIYLFIHEVHDFTCLKTKIRDGCIQEYANSKDQKIISKFGIYTAAFITMTRLLWEWNSCVQGNKRASTTKKVLEWMLLSTTFPEIDFWSIPLSILTCESNKSAITPAKLQQKYKCTLLKEPCFITTR